MSPGEEREEGGSRTGGEEVPRLEYPLRYTFKVMGFASDDFAEHARRVVESALRPGDLPVESVRIRKSAGGKYHSASVVVWLVSEEQRRSIYVALKTDERVVFYL